MTDKINAFEIPYDARTWNIYFEHVVGTVVVDAILRDIFQGGKDHLREQMLDVAAKECRRITWSKPYEGDSPNVDAEGEVFLAKAREALDARDG